MTQGKSAQSVGRIGELSVELEITGRNWLVGNFNKGRSVARCPIPH